MLRVSHLKNGYDNFFSLVHRNSLLSLSFLARIFNSTETLHQLHMYMIMKFDGQKTDETKEHVRLTFQFVQQALLVRAQNLRCTLIERTRGREQQMLTGQVRLGLVFDAGQDGHESEGEQDEV